MRTGSWGHTAAMIGYVALLAVLDLEAQVPTEAQERAAALSVLVRDPAGRPVSGVEMLVSGADWHAGATDATGQVRFRVVPGLWDIAPSHGEFAILPTDHSVLLRNGESSGLEFRALPKTGVVRGRVVFRSPQPPALTGPLTAAAYAASRDGGSLPVSATRLSDEHAFQLAVPPGRWRIRLLEVVSDDVGREVLVEAGREADVEFNLDFQGHTGAAGFVFEAGLITERIGPAFSSTTVGLYAIGADGRPRVLARTQARADQTYAVLAPAPGGTATYVFAWRPGGFAVPAAVRSQAGVGAATFADFRFVPASGIVAGSVVDGANRSVQDAWVEVVSAVRFEDWMMWGRPIRALDGIFHIRVPQGPVLVRAWRESGRMSEPVRLSVSGSAPVTARLVVP